MAKILPGVLSGWRGKRAKDHVVLKSFPVLKNPVMLAAWPGVGEVALIVVRYLRDKLKAEEFGELEAFHFFEPGGVLVKDNVVETPHFPSNKLYFWRNPAGDGDLVLFLGDEQPPAKSYDLAGCLLKTARRLKVRRIYTCAAALARIHHMEKPKVWLVATRQELLKEAATYGLNIGGGNFQIAGLNGLLLGAAKEGGVDAVCLLGEVPVYATRVAHPKAALAVLEVLSQVLGVTVDLAELRDWANRAQEEMKKLSSEAMGEFIQHFTQPLWEQNPPGGEE